MLLFLDKFRITLWCVKEGQCIISMFFVLIVYRFFFTYFYAVNAEFIEIVYCY